MHLYNLGHTSEGTIFFLTLRHSATALRSIALFFLVGQLTPWTHAFDTHSFAHSLARSLTHGSSSCFAIAPNAILADRAVVWSSGHAGRHRPYGRWRIACPTLQSPVASCLVVSSSCHTGDDILIRSPSLLSCRSSSRVIERPPRPSPSEWTLKDQASDSRVLRSAAHYSSPSCLSSSSRTLWIVALPPCRLVTSRHHLVASRLLSPCRLSPPRPCPPADAACRTKPTAAHLQFVGCPPRPPPLFWRKQSLP